MRLNRILLSGALSIISMSAWAQSQVTNLPIGWGQYGNTVSIASVTNSSSRTQLGWVGVVPKAPANAYVCNSGSNTAYIALGDSSVAATTSNFAIPAPLSGSPPSCYLLALNGAAYIAAITSSSTTTISAASGNGSPVASGGGGAGGGGGGITQLTGDATAGPGSGSQAAIVVAENGHNFPISGTASNVTTMLATGMYQDSGTALSSLAPLASPTFTGTVTVASIINSAAASNLALNAPTGQNVQLDVNSTPGIIWNGTNLYPNTTNAYTLGGSSNFFTNTYTNTVNGPTSAALNLTAGTAQEVVLNSGSAAIHFNGGNLYPVATQVVALGGSSNEFTTIFGRNLRLTNLTTGTNADFLCLDGSGNVIIQTSACTISSLRFKDVMGSYTRDALSVVKRLDPIVFSMKPGARPNADINYDRPQIGLAAENVAAIEPRCAIYEQDGKTPKSYRQECLIAVLIAAVQTQQREIDQLRR